MHLKVTNKTAYSTELLEVLVEFAIPDEWNHLRGITESSYPVSFRRPRQNQNWLYATFDGHTITVHVPLLLDLPFYGNRVIRNRLGPALIGGGQIPQAHKLPKKEQLSVTNFTEWLLAQIAQEIHHAYLHWINPHNYVNARRSPNVEATQEKNCARYAIAVIRRWREAYGKKDLPFSQLEDIRKLIRAEKHSAGIDS
jgi:hypothetical protein